MAPGIRKARFLSWTAGLRGAPILRQRRQQHLRDADRGRCHAKGLLFDRAILKSRVHGRTLDLIFISHSCKDGLVAHPPAGTDPEKLARLRFALKLRTQLEDALDPGGKGAVPVWFDRKRLNPGDEWELGIVSALHDCKAAVLLLTPEALESPWVLREATVLADRRSRWLDLRLVPVLCAGVTYQTLAGHPHWAALNVTRWQPVQATRGAYSGKASDQDAAEIVKQVTAQLSGLQMPRDPANERWAEELRVYLDELAKKGHTGRLERAAQALGLLRPKAWDRAALEGLARALLQVGLVEHDAAGQPRFPMPEVLAELFPGDPQKQSLAAADVDFCLRLEPLAAPLAVAAAVGLAPGPGPSAPKVLRADQVLMAELAARRASCNLAWVRELSGVVGEGLGPTEVELNDVRRAVRAAAMGKQTCYVVAPIVNVKGEDPGQLASGLAARLPAQAVVLGVVGRASVGAPAPAAEPVIEVSPEDEDTALGITERIHQLCGKR